VLTLIAPEYGPDDVGRITWDWEPDGILAVTEHMGDGETYTEHYAPGEDDLYALGAYGWTWSADEDEGAEDAATAGHGNPVTGPS
jgi:hypothetical protein